jgi:hypothetical protein
MGAVCYFDPWGGGGRNLHSSECIVNFFSEVYPELVKGGSNDRLCMGYLTKQKNNFLCYKSSLNSGGLRGIEWLKKSWISCNAMLIMRASFSSLA